MAGHSQFKNIMHRKGRQDKVRSKLFGKLAREITVAAKLGLPDPAMNPRLRAAIIAARAENMPKDKIERAIKKGAGRRRRELRRDALRGLRPGRRRRHRRGADRQPQPHRRRRARRPSPRAGGNLAETGAVSFMFDHVGVVEFDAKVANADEMLEAAIEAGAEDVVSGENGHEIYTAHGFAARGRQGAGRRSSASRARRRWSGSRRTRSRSTTRRARSCSA